MRLFGGARVRLSLRLSQDPPSLRFGAVGKTLDKMEDELEDKVYDKVGGWGVVLGDLLYAALGCCGPLWTFLKLS